MSLRRSRTDWVDALRDAVAADTGSGWTVSQDRGAVRLKVREPGPPPRTQSIALPYAWDAASRTDAHARIRAIFAFYDQAGGSLAVAADLAGGRSSRAVIDWPGAVEAFRVQRVERQKVTSAATWAKKYQPVLGAAVAALAARKPPADAQALLDLVLERWKPGSRSRQISRQSLSNFLVFAVARRNFPKVWLPPVQERETRTPKRVGYPLSDAQILRLLDGLPSTPAGERWRFAVQLLAVYGLRPEELRHLVPQDGGIKCEYRKAAGPGRTTKPRRLHALLLRDVDGTPVDWNLAARLAIGEPLPPLGQPGKGGECCRTFLRRQQVWQALTAEVEAVGKELVPYAFRHRYAKSSHAAGLPVASIAEAMGHKVAVHLAAYADFMPDAVAAAYEQANRLPGVAP